MKRYSSIIFLLSLTLHAGAQRPFSRDYWLNENATPVKINALAKDSHGYLWLGDDAGLYCFNGRSFKLITDTPGGHVTAITAVGDTIYCGYSDGRMTQYADGALHTFQPRGARPSAQITSLTWHAGCLWACTDAEGIFAFVNGYGYHLDTRNGLSDDYVYAIAFSGASHALVATDRGVNIISMQADGKIDIRMAHAEGMPDNIVRALSSVPGESPGAWGGLQDGGPLHIHWESDRKSRYESDRARIAWPDSWQWGQINDVLPLADDHAWIATEDGYLVDCRYTRELGFEMKPHHFPGKRFRKLLQDASGSLWCATGDGITLVTDNYISYLPMSAPYSLSGITAMVCDRQNNLYYTQGAVLYKCPLLQPESPVAILKAKAPLTCLYIDNADRLWVGTLGAGLWCREGNNIRELQDVPKLLAGQILDISGTGNSLWVSSLNGVEEIVFADNSGTIPRSVVHHGKHTGTGSDYVYQLFPDRKGNMWMATDGAGICMYDGAHYHNWDSASGLDSKVIYSITEDTAGHIWAASLGKGLYEFTDNSWQHLDRRRQGLQDINISAIAANASGQVIVVHAKGIDEWYPGSGQFRHYNRRMGMDIDSQSNALNCYATDTAGNVWVPFEHGIICFHNLSKAYDLQPGIAIDEVLLFFKSVPAAKHTFDAAENHIGFRFDGINFTNPERLYYRYRLGGYDTGWINTIDESVTFPQLPAEATGSACRRR